LGWFVVPCGPVLRAARRASALVGGANPGSRVAPASRKSQVGSSSRPGNVIIVREPVRDLLFSGGYTIRRMDRQALWVPRNRFVRCFRIVTLRTRQAETPPLLSFP